MLGGACPTAPASVVLRAPWLFDLRCVGMASASRDIRLRRSTLVLLNLRFWKSPEESLTVWFARIELPEEFHAGFDNNNDVDIVDANGCSRLLEPCPRTQGFSLKQKLVLCVKAKLQ